MQKPMDYDFDKMLLMQSNNFQRAQNSFRSIIEVSEESRASFRSSMSRSVKFSIKTTQSKRGSTMSKDQYLKYVLDNFVTIVKVPIIDVSIDEGTVFRSNLVPTMRWRSHHSRPYVSFFVSYYDYSLHCEQTPKYKTLPSMTKSRRDELHVY